MISLSITWKGSYGFRSCQLTADIPTFDRVSNRSGSTRAIALDIGVSAEFGMLVFFTNLSLMEF